MGQDLVSIIIPVYNAEKYIEETIKCVLEQTYTNIEIILIDDCSKDNSAEIINKYSEKDNRIKYFKNEENRGAAISRNNGIDKACGRYICYIDADDKWVKEKLEKQVNFMKENDCAFSFTGYEFADEICIPNGKKVYVPSRLTYKQALKNTTISTITVMFDITKIDKSLLYMPDVESEDTACWWKILKSGYTAYGLNEILSYYRRFNGSLSSNKLTAIKRIWRLYRKEEKLNIFYTLYCFCWYAFHAVMRRI